MTQESITQSGGDELDPELIKLPGPKTRIRPVMALAVIAMCVTVGVHLLDDLRFSQLDDTPIQADIAALGDALDNRYIEIELHPDRPQAMQLLVGNTSTGQVLMPVMGTEQNVWLMVSETPWGDIGSPNQRYRGRLSKIRDLGFYEELADWVATGPNVSRPIALEEVRRALNDNSLLLHDVAGDTVTVTPDSFVSVQETSRTLVQIEAVSTERHASEAAWQLALSQAGIMGQLPAVTSTPSSWTFHVPATSVKDVANKLQQAEFFAATAAPVTRARSGTWGDFSLEDGDMVFAESSHLSQQGFAIQSISVAARATVPAQAYLVNATESPQTYWHTLPLFLLVVFFGLLFFYGFVRSVRERLSPV